MKNLLQLFIFFSTVLATAQLYVAPNATNNTDSYVYVSDEVLFVEQDVNLQLNNNNATTTGSIYLRNGAQLIQGATASNNSGDGLLSVYQDAPESDKWTYNYWCSPVGNETLSGSGNVNFGMYRLYDIQSVTASNQTLRTTGYDGSISPLTISSRWTYIHLRGTETEGDYTRINASDLVPAGTGFLMKGVGPDNTSFNYDFRGRPNNGNMTINVYNGELTLSGNPYPSALDLNRMFWDPDNSEIVSFKYWDEDKTKNSHYYSQNAGGYGTYVPGASNPNGNPGDIGFEAGLYTIPTFSIYDAAGNTIPDPSATTPNNYERRFAPIGQGFMVVPDASDDGVVHIKNSYRRFIQEGAANFSEFRNAEEKPNEHDNNGNTEIEDITIEEGTSEADTRLPQLRINTDFKTSHIRQILLAFNEETTDGFDRGFDGKSPMDAVGAEVYFPIAKNTVTSEGTTLISEPYVIQTLPFNSDKKIPLTLNLSEQFDIEMTAIEQIHFNQHAYLWDNVEDTYKEITNENVASLTLDAGNYENRFYIVFNDRSSTFELSEGTLHENEVRENVDFFQNNPVKQLEVSNPEGYTIKKAQFFDMSGKLVIQKQDLGDASHFTFSTSLLSDGVYMVRLTTIDNVNIDYKMVVHNK
ncbi:MAG: T9SS type A sorting domain-containing protein [Flavobacteriales bacterium]